MPARGSLPKRTARVRASIRIQFVCLPSGHVVVSVSDASDTGRTFTWSGVQRIPELCPFFFFRSLRSVLVTVVWVASMYVFS